MAESFDSAVTLRGASMRRAVLLSVTGLLLTACAVTESAMREATLRRAAFDLGCDPAKLDAVELNWAHGGYERTYGVSGCERKATYIVQGNDNHGYTVVLNSPNTPAAPQALEPAGDDRAAAPDAHPAAR